MSPAQERKYPFTHRFRGLRYNKVVARVALVAAVAAGSGAVYVAWPDLGAGPAGRSPSLYVMAPPPAQLPQTGSYVDSRILPDGDIRVEYWVRASTPIEAIELVVPRGDGPGGAPRAADVALAAERFEVSYGDVVDGSARYRLDSPSRIVRLRYTLVGAVVRSPSARGRALARFTSADPVNAEDDGPRIVRIHAPEVLNVACRAPSPGAEPRPCGSPKGASWQVTLEGADRADEVSAQVNLVGG